MTSPQPPALARSWIEILAPAGRRDAIVGDLLEEYHETQVPEFGVVAANRWFRRQALGFLWSAAAVPGMLVGAILTARTLLDVARPLPDTADRAWLTTLAIMATFTLTGFRLGLSTRRISGAIAMAVAATAVGTVAAYTAVFIAMGVAGAFVHPGPAAWAGLREGLDVPAHVIVLIGTALAAIGAAYGRAFPKAYIGF
jgi:hypothetical protein